MPTPNQEKWYNRIHNSLNPSKFSAKTMEKMMKEGGSVWRYEQDPHNTPTYKEGWERIFGERDDIGSNLANKE